MLAGISPTLFPNREKSGPKENSTGGVENSVALKSGQSEMVLIFFFLQDLFILILYVWVFLLMCVCATCMHCLQRPERHQIP